MVVDSLAAKLIRFDKLTIILALQHIVTAAFGDMLKKYVKICSSNLMTYERASQGHYTILRNSL